MHAYNEWLHDAWGFAYKERIYTTGCLTLWDTESSIAEAGVFVQQYFRDLMPGQVGFAYSIGGSPVTAVP